MRRKPFYKQEWFVTLVLGICVFVFGVSVSLYFFSGTSNLDAFILIFFAGWGFGYIICSSTIRKWEKKSWELANKEQVDEQVVNLSKIHTEQK